MAENPFFWSITASSNDTADPAVAWPEGMLPGAVNNSARALMAGVARLIGDLNGTVATTGSSNTYNITSNCAHSTYTNGILISGRANFTNTGAATLNLNSYGAKSIRVFGPSGEVAAAAGQIQASGIYQFRYDSAANSAAGAFILLNPSPDPTTQISTGKIIVHTTDTLPSGYLWANGAAVSRTTYAALFAEIGTTYGAGDGSTTFNVPDLCGRAPFGSDDMGGISAKSRITNAGSGIVGTTLGASGGVESVTLTANQIPAHTHTGTTDSGGADHTHSGTTGIDSNDHTHTYTGPSATNGTFTGPGGTGWSGSATATTSGIGAQAHTHSFTTGTASAVSHSHTFTSASIGGGLLHSNMSPALILNFIIKT